MKRLLVLLFLLAGCQRPDDAMPDVMTEVVMSENNDMQIIAPENESGQPELGGENKFKVPVPKGYFWEITQSWAEHCEICNSKGYFGGGYCDATESHMWNCCLYSWDFNLPSDADEGKPILASANGKVKYAEADGDWGGTVVLDHGDNICTRYAHMLYGSMNHLSKGQTVCQGLMIGKIGGTPNFKPHLHFQFEECNTGKPIKMGFTDGNGVPVCAMGKDVFDNNGNYSLLKLTNELKQSCEKDDEPFGGGNLPIGGWVNAKCGSLKGCPLIPNCGRSANHQFSDGGKTNALLADAAAYLWSECALDGKSDGGLYPEETITRAEALKIAVFLFGLHELNGKCKEPVNFLDVEPSDWYYETVSCGLKYIIVEKGKNYFNPEEKINLAEAAKFLVAAAIEAGVVQMQVPGKGHFSQIPSSHWSYGYFETLYTYGGLTTEYANVSPAKNVKRGEFVMMAAALSPCWCHNVSCEGGCQCLQANFACSKPGDPGPEEGGGSEPDEPKPDDEPQKDVELNCNVDEDDLSCKDGKTILLVRCQMQNNTKETIKINNLVMKMVDATDMKHCQMVQSDLFSGAATINVAAGEKKKLNGNFQIACDPAVSSELEIEVSFDLLEKISGEKTWYYEVTETTIWCEDEYFQFCDTPVAPPPPPPPPSCTPKCDGKSCGADGCGGTCQCANGQQCAFSQCYKPKPWKCDSKYALPFEAYATDGWVEGYHSGKMTPDTYFSYKLSSNPKMIYATCDLLPVVMLLHGGSSASYIAVSGSTNDYPQAALWQKYKGKLTYTPAVPASAIAYGVYENTPYTNTLMVFPTN